MKKIFILIVISLLSVCSYAQLDKGGWITSLHGYGSASKMNDYKESTLRIQPSVMKLIGHNLALGITLSTTFQSNTYPTTFTPILLAKTNTLDLEAGPVLRKYFGDYKFKPYAEFSTGLYYTQYKSIYEGVSYHSDYSKLYIKPALGMSYWISDRVALDMKVSYDLNHHDYGTFFDNWNLNLGFSVKLGK
ncbi:MAG: hypothetical protein ACM3ME_01430 [Chloroflexota bacterium]